MKVCIIHGSPRRGNTYKATEIIKEELLKATSIQFDEFFLPADMPSFCCGCYTCFEVSEDKCPHSKHIQPIVQAMREADGLILTSPVYVLAESGGMKAFLDHLAYMYLPHRPMEEMFSKVAMVISTTAGTGTSYAIKPIARNLKFWGVKRVIKCGFSMAAKNWEDMSDVKKEKLSRLLRKKSRAFYFMLEKRDLLRPQIFTRIMFMMMRRMINGYKDGNADKEYWRKKGWLMGKNSPF
ncbi:NAD(P)H-dependent oxidoreductase [Alkaliphilus pronyensis]|uniref:NAD(P)H-dependent oxidoreductase n=1 Tax=Alkaliphilus pronyensis TaxID=1482732 RepID=A0A6I0FBB9_9FIRM|nr:NAD(P)H-dependent oxidoreductase [Alkaliphilus pronyensis]